MIIDDSGIKADARLEQIVEAINERDKEGLKSLFSAQAQYDAENLDETIDYLFEFVSGDIESWAQRGGSTRESRMGGVRLKESGYWYYVNTDREQYLFDLVEYLVDSENPLNIGLYRLTVTTGDNEDFIFHGAGIGVVR